MDATATAFVPDFLKSTMAIETPSISYREAMTRALENPAAVGKVHKTPHPPCPQCASPAALSILIPPSEPEVSLGTLAWLPKKRNVPMWSIALQQPELNDGAFAHPGVPFEYSQCGHLCRVAPMTSFGGRSPQEKYAGSSEETLDDKLWEYLAINNAVPSNGFGALTADKPTDKPSYIHLDNFYWIETRNLGNKHGDSPVLTRDALAKVQLACAAAEKHRDDNHIEPFYKRGRSYSPAKKSVSRTPSPPMGYNVAASYGASLQLLPGGYDALQETPAYDYSTLMLNGVSFPQPAYQQPEYMVSQMDYQNLTYADEKVQYVPQVYHSGYWY